MFRLGRFREHRHTWFGNVIILTFLLTQAADGVLTYLGVHLYGVAAEGNPLLAWLMHALGEGPALAAAKLTAAGVGGVLHLMTVHRLIAVLTGVYLLAAIAPWLAILFPANLCALFF
jgi:hypothetical protein